MLSIFQYALVFLEYSSSSFSQNYFWNFDEVITITDIQTDSRVMILNSQFHIFGFFRFVSHPYNCRCIYSFPPKGLLAVLLQNQ